MQNTGNMLEWSTNSQSGGVPVKPQRSSTRGASINNHQLNQTHLNLGNFKKSNLTSSKLSGIQSILNKVPQGGNVVAQGNKAQPNLVDQK